MIEQDKIISLIDFWRRSALSEGLLMRDLVKEINIKGKEIVDIIGPRRCGKSSVLKILFKITGGGLFINFEDPFFIENNRPGIIDELIECYRQYFDKKLKYLFFDEIQNIAGWERALNKLREAGEYKIFITGSSAKLLSRELATLLTGRHLSYTLLPLSFSEFLRFNNIKLAGVKDRVLQNGAIIKAFKDYLRFGGFPEVVLTRNEELLKQYYTDILNKDIVARYMVRRKGVLERLGVYLLSNSAKLVSLASITKTFGISFTIASAYVEYFKEAFLVFNLPQFSYSLKTQEKTLKKIFASDIGLARNVSFRFSDDQGRMLENCAYLHLRARHRGVYYYKTKSGHEVDFLITDGKKKELIQVCLSLTDEKTKSRESASLFEAMAECKINNGTIVTDEDVKESLIRNGKQNIAVVPMHRWLMR